MFCQVLREAGSNPHPLLRAMYEPLWRDESAPAPTDINWNCKNQYSVLNITYFTNFTCPVEPGSGLIWIVRGKHCLTKQIFN